MFLNLVYNKNRNKCKKDRVNGKGKCKLEVSNYRLVSVLPILSKVLEKLMFNSTVDFPEKVKLYININMASKTASPHHILPLIFIQEL